MAIVPVYFGQALTGQAVNALNTGDPTTGFPVLLVSTEGDIATYSGSATAFATYGTTPTDVMQLIGPTTKVARLTRIRISGMTSSAVETIKDLFLIKRSSLGTLGSAVQTAITVAPHDPNDAAAQCVLNTIGTANYTTLGTSVGTLRADKYALALATATATDFPEPSVIEWDFTTNNEKAPILRNNAQMLSINMNSIALVGTIGWDISWTWTESPQ
jgi:hypothetical protein